MTPPKPNATSMRLDDDTLRLIDALKDALAQPGVEYNRTMVVTTAVHQLGRMVLEDKEYDALTSRRFGL